MVRKNGKSVTLRVHRFVAKLFASNPENLKAIKHRDGNRLNNKVSNLIWIRTGGAKLLKGHIEQIKTLYAQGWSQRRIAKLLNVSRGCVIHSLKCRLN